MDEVNEEITIAQNRADEIIFENASVFMRSKLYEALPGSDEEKLKNYTNTNDFWPIQSGAAKTKDKEEIENARKHYKEEMLPRPAMFGEGENRKFRCPSMNIGFTTIIRQDVRDGQTARASSKLEPKMASFHSSAPAPKKNSRAKKLGSGSKIENQSQKARLWLQNKTNQSQKLGSGSRIFLRLDHQ